MSRVPLVSVGIRWEWFNPTKSLQTLNYGGKTDYRVISLEFGVVQPHRTSLNYELRRENWVMSAPPNLYTRGTSDTRGTSEYLSKNVL